jgi:hypothetical protein
LPALTPEIALAEPAVREAFDKGLRDVHNTLSAITGLGDSAWALIAQRVAAMKLARAALDPTLHRSLLSTARVEARRLLQEKSASSGDQTNAQLPGRATSVSCGLRPDELAFVLVASRSTTK